MTEELYRASILAHCQNIYKCFIEICIVLTSKMTTSAESLAYFEQLKQNNK